MKKLITLIIFISLTTGLFALPNLLKKEDFGANAIDNIEVNLSWENIIVKETYDNSAIEVEIYSNYKKYSPEVYVSGYNLYIDSVKKNFSFIDIGKNPT